MARYQTFDGFLESPESVMRAAGSTLSKSNDFTGKHGPWGWLRSARYPSDSHQYDVGGFLDECWAHVLAGGECNVSERMGTVLTRLVQTTGALPAHSIHVHYPELAIWFVVLAAFTWAGAIAATARDIILASLLTCLAIGSTIACCLFAYGNGVNVGIKVAAYFWMASSLLAWWRVTVYLMEEAYGPSKVSKFFPVFRTSLEKGAPLIVPGLGEPGVKRGMPGRFACKQRLLRVADYVPGVI
ncbi:hypothetical protein M8818_004377 [Zalaria obscura]|uniref:Uncharacterized protein n=1 Tax=Zalaria obscura TaxID=2024903 RepID=A0ACC3SAY0_9PEZI